MVKVIFIQETINLTFDLYLVLSVLNLTATLVLVIVVVRALKGERNSRANATDRLRVFENSIINKVEMLRNSIEGFKNSSVNVLSAIEIKLKEIDRIALNLHERLERKLSRIELALVDVTTVKSIDRLEDVDCIFREDGLIIYGSYDKKFVAHIVQALRALESLDFNKVEVTMNDFTVAIGMLGQIRGKSIYCLRKGSSPVKFNSKGILKELGDIIG